MIKALLIVFSLYTLCYAQTVLDESTESTESAKKVIPTKAQDSIRHALSRKNRIKQAIAVDVKKTYEPGGLYQLQQQDHPDFYRSPTIPDKIIYLLRQFHMVPDKCFSTSGIVDTELKIEKGEIKAANNTDTIFYIKVKSQNDWNTVYVVKVPSIEGAEDYQMRNLQKTFEKWKEASPNSYRSCESMLGENFMITTKYFMQTHRIKTARGLIEYLLKEAKAEMSEFNPLQFYNSQNQRDKEIRGLIWARDLLGHLPRTREWPQLKFHEAIFNYQDGEETGTLIFLHGAKGKPLFQYFDEMNEKCDRHECHKKDGKQYVDLLFKFSRQLALLEQYFVKGDVTKPESLYSITFHDAHGGNVFYDEKTDTFSWIDLSTLGYSAMAYYDPTVLFKLEGGRATTTLNEFRSTFGEGLDCLIAMNFYQHPGSTFVGSMNLRSAALEAFLLGYYSVVGSEIMNEWRKDESNFLWIKGTKSEIWLRDRNIRLPLLWKAAMGNQPKSNAILIFLEHLLH